MSSRFFARGGSDSDDDDDDEESTASGSGSESGSDDSGSRSGSDDDSSSDDSSSDDSDDEDDEKRGSRFLAGADSDDDDDDDRRVVLSARDKKLSELSGVCEEIRNKIKINDWIASATLFDKMNKLWEKMAKMAALRGGKVIKVPKVYLRTLVELDNSLTTTLGNKELRKKMSTTNSKSLNAMKQRLKKHNKDFEAEIEAFKAARLQRMAAAGVTAGVRGDFRDGDGEFRGGDENEIEDDDEFDDEEDDDDLIEGEIEEGDESGAAAKEDIFSMDPEDVTEEMVEEKLKEIALERGKKGTNRRKTVDQLTALSLLTKSTEQKLQVLMLIVSSLFDLNPSLSSTMSNVTWQRTVVGLLDILKLLEENPNLVFADDVDVGPPTFKPEQNVKKIAGNLFAFVERIDDELFKTFQVMDPHTNDYVQRLQDELKFLLLADKVAEYFYRFGIKHNLAKLFLRRLEHLYYKHTKVYDAMRRGIEQAKASALSNGSNGSTIETSGESNATANGDGGINEDGEEGSGVKEELPVFVFPEEYSLSEDLGKSMKSVCKVIYRFGDERTKARAMLCEIYHKAIHDDFYGARDLMLMSHLQDVIQNMDILTQILFNRSMAQLGLAAFRIGLINEAHSCVGELHMGGSLKIKELLAQGVSNSRYHDKTAEQEKLERRRQMPFHMHINLELLEAVHLTTAMLLEVPSMALHAQEPSNRRIISRNFVRLLDHYERLTFTGPPENVKDHIMSAAILLSNGQWAESYSMIEKLAVWKLFERSEEIIAMIRRKIQEEALKAYVFTSVKCYTSLSIKQLCTIFGMEEKQAQSVISKLIMSEEIKGAWDQTTGTLLMHAVEPSPLQSKTIQYCDKMSLLFETNERALELRGGGRLTSRDDDDSGAKDGGSSRDKRFGNDRHRNDRDSRFRDNDRESRGGGGGGGRDSTSRFGSMHKQYNNFGRKDGRLMSDSFSGGNNSAGEYTSGADMIRRGGDMKRGGMGGGGIDRRSNDRMVSLGGSWRDRR